MEEILTLTVVTLPSPRAKHGKIMRTKSTLIKQKTLKRLQAPLKKRHTNITHTLPHPDTIHPLFVRHVLIARKIGIIRYKLARTRPPRQINKPILPQQGTVLNMIWSWALSTFAPETLEQ
jgi:hypothetical protein